MQINWIKPVDQTPPFGEQIMIMLGGSGSNDAGRTFEPYVRIMNGVMSERSPNDDERGDDYQAWLSGPQDDWDDYQFMVYAYDDWRYGLGDVDDSDWMSDSILAWAPMPQLSVVALIEDAIK